ncbi:MAG: hypothetical protein ACPG5B_17485 [Chitinophagales bacterium]
MSTTKPNILDIPTKELDTDDPVVFEQIKKMLNTGDRKKIAELSGCSYSYVHKAFKGERNFNTEKGKKTKVLILKTAHILIVSRKRFWEQLLAKNLT